MLKNLPRVTVYIAIMFATFFISFPILAKSEVIYGFENAKHYQHNSSQPIYIQAGSFLDKRRAENYQYLIQSRTTLPVRIHRHANFYSLVMGPLYSAQQVRQVAKDVLLQHSHQLVYKQTVKLARHIATDPKWFVSAGVGEEYSQFNSQMTVNNGSGFPAPFNQDVYSTNKRTQPVIAVTAGRRWTRHHFWLPAISLGMRYEYLFQTNVGNTVEQYSTPEFINYNYNWGISSNVLLAYAKLNLFKYERLSPYLSGGIGSAFNHASNYGESAYANVTPRTSPDFDSSTTTRVAYNAGAGIDVEISPQLTASAGYEYLNLGKIASGKGTGPWSSQSLNIGTYYSHQVLFSLNYLF